MCGPVLRRRLGRTAVAVAVAVSTSTLAAVIMLADTAQAVAGELNGAGLLAGLVITVGAILASIVDLDDDSAGPSPGWYIVATSTGTLAITFGYLRFWCDRATAAITGLIEKNQDVSHWSARALVPDTGRQVDFDTYSRDGDGIAVGHKFETIVDPRGWVGPSEPQAVDLFYPAAGITVAVFLVLVLIAVRQVHAAASHDL